MTYQSWLLGIHENVMNVQYLDWKMKLLDWEGERKNVTIEI